MFGWYELPRYLLTIKNRAKRGAPPSWQKEPSTTMPSSNHYCGGGFTDLSGILRSPGYPLYYPNNKVWFHPYIFFSRSHDMTRSPSAPTRWGPSINNVSNWEGVKIGQNCRQIVFKKLLIWGTGLSIIRKNCRRRLWTAPYNYFISALYMKSFFLYLFILRFDKSTEVQYLIDKSLLKHNCLKGLDFEYRTSKFGCMESITCF